MIAMKYGRMELCCNGVTTLRPSQPSPSRTTANLNAVSLCGFWCLLCCRHLPGITSLYLHIPWSHRNTALVMARSQRNVQALELSIATQVGPDRHWEDRVDKPCIRDPYLKRCFPSGPVESKAGRGSNLRRIGMERSTTHSMDQR